MKARGRGVSPKKRAWPLAVVAVAAVMAWLPLPAPFVERFYSTGMYAAIQPAVTFASNAAPLAWIDVLLASVVAAFAALTVRDLTARGWRAAGFAFVRALVWSAALYLLFLAAWGLNYQRQRLTDRLAFDAGGVTPAAVSHLAALAVERLNALHAAAHAEGWVGAGTIDPSLAGAFDRVSRDLGATSRGIVVGRPKRSMLDWYFRRAGVSGMTDPFFLETLVAGDLLPFERPFVVAHEWSHLAGVTDEGEANLVGWMTCVRGSTGDQYSGWLFMYGEAIAAVPARERTAIAGRLAAGPRDDLTAIRERTRRNVDPRLSAAGWRIYDSYLKANRVEAGAASYAEVVRLALGLRVARPFP